MVKFVRSLRVQYLKLSVDPRMMKNQGFQWSKWPVSSLGLGFWHAGLEGEKKKNAVEEFKGLK